MKRETEFKIGDKVWYYRRISKIKYVVGSMIIEDLKALNNIKDLNYVFKTKAEAIKRCKELNYESN